MPAYQLGKLSHWRRQPSPPQFFSAWLVFIRLLASSMMWEDVYSVEALWLEVERLSYFEALCWAASSLDIFLMASSWSSSLCFSLMCCLRLANILNNHEKNNEQSHYQQFLFQWLWVATTASENDDGYVNFNLPVALATVGARALEIPRDLILAAPCRYLTRRLKFHAQLLLVQLVVRLFTSEKSQSAAALLDIFGEARFVGNGCLPWYCSHEPWVDVRRALASQAVSLGAERSMPGGNTPCSNSTGPPRSRTTSFLWISFSIVWRSRRHFVYWSLPCLKCVFDSDLNYKW